MSSEIEIRNMLIDQYKALIRIRQLVAKTDSKEALDEIDREIGYLKLKLQPLELPDN